MSELCQLIGISRQAVYQYERQSKQRTDTANQVLRYVQEYRAWMPSIGTRKLYWLIKPKLEEQGIAFGRDALFSLLKEKGLLIKPKRHYTKTTDSKHWMKKHPNLLKDKKVTHANQVYVSDITYVESAEGVHYLSLVTDAYTRQIKGYMLANDMKAETVVQALHRSMKGVRRQSEIIHHSDRGSQYCSQIYQKALIGYGITPSMTDGYDCYQNALAERVNGILKQEFLTRRCRNLEELDKLVAQSIEIYNDKRPHLSLRMLTPNQQYQQSKNQLYA